MGLSLFLTSKLMRLAHCQPSKWPLAVATLQNLLVPVLCRLPYLIIIKSIVFWRLLFVLVQINGFEHCPAKRKTTHDHISSIVEFLLFTDGHTDHECRHIMSFGGGGEAHKLNLRAQPTLHYLNTTKQQNGWPCCALGRPGSALPREWSFDSQIIIIITATTPTDTAPALAAAATSTSTTVGRTDHPSSQQ